MKKKIIIIVLVLLIALFVGLQMFLSYGLTSSLRKWVLPRAKEQFNLDVAVDHITVNLLAGAMTVHGLQIANPPGFDEADLISVRQCGLDVGLLAFFGGGVADIQKATIKDAFLFVVRNQEGQINIQEVSRALQQGTSGARRPTVPPEPEQDEISGAETEDKKVPDIKIDNVEVNSLVRYVDYGFSEEPVKLGIEIQLRLKHIANYGRDDELSGTVNLQGKFMADKREGKFDLDGRIAPVIDPTRMSFVVTGTIQPIDLTVFRPFARKYGMEAGSVSGTVNLLCDKGFFDSEKSAIELTFNQVRLSENLRKKMQGIDTLESFTIVAPVHGTLIDPKIDIGEAITRTLLSEEVIDTILKSVLEKQTGVSGLLKGEGTDDQRVRDRKKPRRNGDFDVGGALRDILGK